MKIYKKLFAYVDREKYLGYLAAFLSGISAILTIFGYFYIYRFLRDLVVEENIASADDLALKAALALTLGAVLYILSGYFSHKLGFRLETNLRKRGIDGLEKASFRFFDLNPTGKIRKIIDDNAAQTHQVIAHLIPDSAQAFLVPVCAIILGFVIAPRVGATLLVLTLISGAIISRMMGGEDGFMKIYQEALATLSAETVEYVRGMQVVKIFGADVRSFKALYKAIQDYSKYAYEYALSCKTPYVFFQWLLFGFVAILIIPSVLWMDRLGSPVAFITDLIMIFFLSGVLFVSYMKIMWVGMYIFQGNYAVDTLEALYTDMQSDNLTFGDDDTFENYDIAFENVTFGYNETPVLENLSFTLEEGRSYALVGSSGSGKSTVAKLISGFYKIDRGAITIGGKPLETYSHEAIIGAISFVFQNPKLFKTSIYDNVALAKKDATRDDVLKALHLAGCDSILDKFPEREHTVIGSKGVYLSGGEKQRIAIARIMLKDSDIIIMDEASAAIDPDNEHELQKAFKNLIRGKTVLMIAHRLSSIRAVDEILVLDDGKIIERGSDAELMCRNSKYKQLINQYNQANDWRIGHEGVL